MNRTVRNLLAVGVLSLACSASAATLGIYDFNGNTSASSVGNNLTFSSFGSISQGLGTPTQGTTTYTTTGWDNKAPGTTTPYVGFTITPSVGSATINTMTFVVQPNSASTLRVELWNTANTAILAGGAGVPTGSALLTPGSLNTITFNFSAGALSSGINVRIWDQFNSAASGNTLVFDNISVDGTTPVPEPVNVALALFGITTVGIGAGRRFLARAKK